jgi:hypothetical protein
VPHARRIEFGRNLQGWIEAEADEVRDTAIRTDPITPGDVQRNLKSYFLKDGADDVRALWVRPHHKATGGVVAGKRLKVSHAIGPAARRKASQMAQDGQAGVSATQIAKSGATASTAQPAASDAPSKVDPDR